MTGPYESEADTYREPLPSLVRAIHDANLPNPGRQVCDACADALRKACDDTGVDLGGYDASTIDGLANLGPSTVQVIIGLIYRAHETGRRTA